MNDVTVDASRQQLPAADPNVRIPSSVRAAADRANAHYAPPAPPAPEQSNPASVTVAVNDQAAPQQPSSVEEWERNYRAMQGRFTKEQAEKKALADQLAQMATSLTATQQQLRQVTQPRPQQQRLLTAEEHETYGEEFINVVKKAAKEDMAPVVTALQQQVSHLQGRLTENSQANLFTTLDSRIQNWRVINTSPDFLSWLRLPDPYSGAIRQALLTEAFQTGDATRVLRFFEGFIRESETVSVPANPAPSAQAPHPSGAPQRQAAMTLDQLAAPGRARAAPVTPVSAAGGKPIYSRVSIGQFYEDLRKGLYRGRDDEKNRIERDIFAAQSEGRITG